MELKIFTDCSHHKKIGSWSVLFHSGKGEENLVISGICPNYISTAAQGETYAVFKGVELAKKIFPKHSKLKIYTDCIGLLNVLKPTAKSQKHPVNRMIQQSVIKKLSTGGYDYEILFVRGHQLNKVSNEALYNNIVDEHARKIRRKNQNPIQNKNGIIRILYSFIPYVKVFHSHFFQVLEVVNPVRSMTESKAMV